MSRMIDTANIRVGARNFYAAAHEMHGNAKHLDHIYQNLSSGQNGWKGEGAEAFQTVNHQMRDDCYAAARAFERTSSVLSTLAGMFDQVNQLRQQADHLDRQIDSLESHLWGAEETRRSSLRSVITQLRHRKFSLEHEADSLEYRAHSAASSQFQQIEAMANRLHYGPGGPAHAEEGGLIDKAKNSLGGLWDSAKEAVDEIGDKAEEFGDFLEAKAGDLEHFVEEKMDEWLDDEMEYYARIAWGNFGDFAEGAVCSFANNMTYGLFEEYLLDDDPSRGQAYFLGRIGGDAAAGAVGAALTEVGFGAASGGGSTAVAALAGGPAGWVVSGGALVVAGVGVAGMAYGGGVVLHSAAQASKDWDLLMRAQGSSPNGGSGRTYQADQVRKIEDDFLDRSEAGKGHLLEKHIGQRNEDLIKRASQEGVDATTFTDKQTAIKATKENIRKNADKISDWLNNMEAEPRLMIEVSHSFEVGKGVATKNSGSTAAKQITYGLNSSKVILIKDSTMAEGFRVLTGFPVIK